MFNKDNYFKRSYGVWASCEEPSIRRSFKSEDSVYWVFDDYVIRKSNHWGKVGSNFWKLNNQPKHGFLIFDQPQTAKIEYKDLGIANQAPQPSPRKRFMSVQPDIDYTKPITPVFLEDLVKQLQSKCDEVSVFKPVEYDREWPACRDAWYHELDYGVKRLAGIAKKAQFKHLDENDKKCVNIALCLLRDFEKAKQANFLKPEEKE